MEHPLRAGACWPALVGHTLDFGYTKTMNQHVAEVTLNWQPRYVEDPTPIVFPEEESVPETQLHLELRTLLYQLLSDYLGIDATVGSEQFVYYAADDPRQCLAPDVFVRKDPRGDLIRSWKTWERGAPHVAVEITSDSDAPELPWEEKLSRYQRLGVSELVRFDPLAAAGKRLRLWDRVKGTLVERELTAECAPSRMLGLCWVVASTGQHATALRIALDADGQQLVPTQTEARQAAEARIAELEAELTRRG